jgi:hypothetical protein
MPETPVRASLHRVARATVLCGTLAALAWFAYGLVSVAFRLGPRLGIRSAIGILLPLFAGCYGFATGRHSLRRIGALPVGVRFAVGLAAGALALASVPFFLPMLPLPGSELLIASCIAALALGFASDAERATPLVGGVAVGMVLYLAVWGVPRIVPG